MNVTTHSFSGISVLQFVINVLGRQSEITRDSQGRALIGQISCGMLPIQIIRTFEFFAAHSIVLL